MRTTFIATVLNEEKNVQSFLDSILSQTQKIDEIIIVDGGSTDSTLSIISNKNLKIKVIVKKGNRSVGRNVAIRNASGDIILCSDAGCILDKNWSKNIIKPFKDSKIDVVAGYYRGKYATVFQKCLVPYVLVMPDKVNPENFLPATRSMAFKKSIWEKVKGFPEEYSNNEDYVFAKKLKKAGANIVLRKDAIVNWIPRKNIKESFVMFFRFSKGDMEANIIRWKVVFLFVRYLTALFLIDYFVISRSIVALDILVVLFLVYILWAIFKNYKYVKNLRALYILPFLQFTADMAVLIGSSFAVLGKSKKF